MIMINGSMFGIDSLVKIELILGQFGTESKKTDNLAPGQFGTRTIWHRTNVPNCPFYYVGAKLSWCPIVRF